MFSPLLWIALLYDVKTGTATADKLSLPRSSAHQHRLSAADIDSTTREGLTALSIAAGKWNRELVRQLLDRGANGPSAHH